MHLQHAGAAVIFSAAFDLAHGEIRRLLYAIAQQLKRGRPRGSGEPAAALPPQYRCLLRAAGHPAAARLHATHGREPATVTIPANIADLMRLEDEIDEAMLNCLDNPTGQVTLAELKHRKLHLHDEIECLLHDAEAVAQDAEAALKPGRPH